MSGKMDLKIQTPITLPCGLMLPNRLAKAAMAETWAGENQLPHEAFIDTYSIWANSGWGLIMSGNVQVDISHLGNPHDLAINDSSLRPKQIDSWKRWAKVCNKAGTPTILQLNHPGRQSTIRFGTRSFFSKAIAPSPLPLNIGTGLIALAVRRFIFGTPREMTSDDVRHVISCFVEGAKMSYEAGFAGIELHAAHGYLLAQFLGADTNRRTDLYGGSPENRSRIIVEIIQEIRKAVPKTFCIGIKFNSVDHQNQTELAHCVQQLKGIVNAGIDFLEISGGSYEDPKMIAGYSINDKGPAKISTVTREAFFIEFAQAIRRELNNTPLIVTGGFRTREGMERAVASGACDIVGIGRPAVLCPDLPCKVIFNKDVVDSDAKLRTEAKSADWLAAILGIKMLARGRETLWYSGQIHNILSKYGL